MDDLEEARREAEVEARDALLVTRKLASELLTMRAGDSDARRRAISERQHARQRFTLALARYERLGGDPHDITYRAVA